MACCPINSSVDDLVNLCRLGGESDSSANSFHLLDQYLQKMVGHCLLTILSIDPTQTYSERIYSSRPELFAAGGQKALDAAPQMRELLAAGKPLIVNGREAIRQRFPDHARMFAVGCECVINVPLRWQGKAIANVNVLGALNAYDENNAAMIEVACHLVLPVMLGSLPVLPVIQLPR